VIRVCLDSNVLIAAGVQILVTGDRDLLDVAAESPIPILSPRAFMVLTRGGGG
jgi:predicted nucleic acid-binding protein